MKLSRSVSAAVAAVMLDALAVAAFAAPGAALLGFGSEYAAPDGSTCVHRGVDVGAAPGSSFDAPVTGTVKFAGRVPGPHGGSVRAVTLETADGTVSMLPFEDLSVAKGDVVEAGDRVGRVAQDGDPSSSDPHVHLSLRHGDLYVDPSVLLAAPIPHPEPEPEPEPQVSAAPSEKPAPAPALSAAPPAAAPSPVLAQGVTLAPSAVDLPEVETSEPSTVSSPEAKSLATDPGVHVPGLAAAPEAGVAVVAPAARGSHPADAPAQDPMTAPVGTLLDDVATRMLAGVRSSSHALAPAAAALGFAVAAGVYLLGRRSLERRLDVDSPVSDRLGRLLQQLRAGDTLRGLTSCSGHAAFTVPEPFSPREVTK